MSFVALVFAMSVVVMLLLKLFMRDDTWSVLDLLALCVSFCGVAAYIVTSEPRARHGVGDLDLEGGRPRHPRGNLAVNQPAQPPPTIQPDEDARDDPTTVQPSTRTDSPFTIGDDSTLGDRDPGV